MQALHLVANRREHATTWLLGLQALARRATQQAVAQQATAQQVVAAAGEEADGGDRQRQEAAEAAREAHVTVAATEWSLGALLPQADPNPNPNLNPTRTPSPSPNPNPNPNPYPNPNPNPKPKPRWRSSRATRRT